MNIVPIETVGCHPETGPRMILPVPTVYVHHQGGSLLATEPATLQMMQRHGDATGHRGIEYSYLIAPSGTVYRGYGDLVGAHTRNQNRVSLGVCFMGNYTTAAPTGAAVASMRALVGWLLETGRITSGYRLVAHRDAPGAATACPGDGLYPHLAEMRHDYGAAVIPPTMEVDTDMSLYAISDVASSAPGRTVAARLDPAGKALHAVDGYVTLDDWPAPQVTADLSWSVANLVHVEYSDGKFVVLAADGGQFRYTPVS